MRIRAASVVAFLAGLGVALGGLLSAQDRADAQKVRIVDIAAERFAFTPSEIKTTVGTPLQIRLRSDDTGHGFRIVGTDVDIEIPKRGRGASTVHFTPSRAGRYTFECSKLCGAGHAFMRGVIVVQAAPSEQR